MGDEHEISVYLVEQVPKGTPVETLQAIAERGGYVIVVNGRDSVAFSALPIPRADALFQKVAPAGTETQKDGPNRSR